jgi:cytochrome c551/c552
LFAALAILISFVGGFVISAIVRAITKFFRARIPSPALMAQLNATSLALPVSQPQAPRNLSKFAIVGLFLIGVVVTGAVLSFFAFRPIPGAGVSAEKPASSGLAASGDIAKVVAGLPAGSADRGKGLFTSQGCVACHSLDKGTVLVGPSLAGVFTTAATREPNVGAKEYLYESLVLPNKFVVDKFQPNLMPQTFAQTLSPAQISDFLAWMERDLK